MVIPGPPAVCEGIVVHRRNTPKIHAFTYPISQVWIDPDHPEALCDLHPAWSSRHMAPARYRRSDYGMDATGSLSGTARSELGAILGRPVRGPVRMLTQIRRWGWLFNPITIYFVWDADTVADSTNASDGPSPVGAVIEVTNTPWKQRHRYPVAFGVSDESGGMLTAEFDKAHHVSPFLGMDLRYRLTVTDRNDLIAVAVDILDDTSSVVLHTALRLDRQRATRKVLQRSLLTTAFPTHRVSAGIHRQALALWAKRVRFHAHPDRRSSQTKSCQRTTEDTTP